VESDKFGVSVKDGRKIAGKNESASRNNLVEATSFHLSAFRSRSKSSGRFDRVASVANGNVIVGEGR